MMETIKQVLNQLREGATVANVYGEPIQVGAKTIVPVAEVKAGVGMGYGKGHKDDDEDEASEASECSGEGEGGGGGGGMSARPVAIVEITEDETKVIPIVDETELWKSRLWLAGFAFGALFLLARGRAK